MRLSRLLLGVVPVALAAAAVSTFSARPVEAAPPPTTASCPATSQQFVSTVDGPLPDNSTRVYPLTVTGVGPWLQDIDVTITLPHIDSADIELSLISPSGTVIPFALDVTGRSSNFVLEGTVFDDQAVDGVDRIITHDNVRLRAVGPSAALAGFIGENPNGTWKLVAADDLILYQGLLLEWRLDVTTTAGPLASSTADAGVLLDAPIADEAVTVFTQDVTGLPPYLVDLNLFVDIPHDAPGDLELFLTSPSGRTILLVADKGSTTTDNIFAGTLFDDQASRRASHLLSPVDEQVESPLVPQQPLAGFIGENPNGRWILRVGDDTFGSSTRGTLKSWRLDFTVAEANAACSPSGITVTSVTPSSDVADGGATVAVSGTGFASGAEVLFGGLPSPSVTVTGPTQLTAVVPASAQVGPVGLTVRLPGGSGVLDRGFTYVDTVPPVLSSLSPDAGVQGFTLVTLTGTNLEREGQAFVDGVPAPTYFASLTSARFLAPPHAAGSAEVFFVNPDGRDSGVITLRYVPSSLPTISTFTPALAPLTGNVRVHVTGTNFAPGMTMTIDGVPATGVRVHTPTNADLIVPPRATPGNVPAVATTGAGSSTPLTFAYVAQVEPVLVSASPRGAPVDGGTEIFVTGRGFAADTVFTFDGIPSPFTYISPDSGVVYTPPHAPGVVPLVATNALDAGDLDGGFVFGALAPLVTSISPNAGPTSGGTAVTIEGANFFGIGSLAPVVRIGGRDAGSVVVVSDTQITAVTPARDAGYAQVEIINPDLQSGELLDGFRYIGPPQIGVITPAIGPTVGGNTVTITGQGFVTTGLTTVTFGANPALNVVVVSPTQITVEAPPGPFNSLVSVTVTNPDGISGTKANAYRYSDQGPLSLTGITPTSGAIDGGYLATLTGDNFAAGSTVTIGGRAGTNLTIVTPQQLTFEVPAGAVGGVKDVVLTGPDSQTQRLDAGFSYLVQNDTCSLAEIIPPGALPYLSTPNDQVFFSGDAGDPLGSCMFSTVNQPIWYAITPTVTGRYQFSTCDGDAPADTTTDNGIAVFTSANGCAGPFVQLTSGACFISGCSTGGGAPVGNVRQSFTLDAGTTYYAVVTYAAGNLTPASVAQMQVSLLPAPIVTAIIPSEGPEDGGNRFTIEGQNFGTTATVTFGGTSATTVSVDAGAGLIFGTVPRRGPGNVAVIVTTSGQTAGVDGGYTFLAKPSVAAVTPNSGSSVGGETVTVTGANFANPTVSFGGIDGVVLPGGSPTSFSATTPAHAPGAVDVVVTNADGQLGRLTNGFTFTLAGGTAPTVTSVSPDAGSSNGATVVQVSGTNFSTTGQVTVSFGGAFATGVQVLSATQLTATTTAHAPGIVGVTVTNPDTQAGTLAAAYRYLAPPALTGFSPQSGPEGGNTAVQLTGGPFAAGSVVRFGAAAATLLSFDAGVIDVTTPPGTGQVPVTVTTAEGVVATAGTQFSYLAAPTISGLAPATGPVTGNTTVVISGTGFRNGAAVLFGSDAANVTALTATTITVSTPSVAAPGVVAVRVTNADGQFALAPAAFTYAAVVVDAGFDAGVPDAGPFDAGVQDAGFDAGVPDAGFDAGGVPDAGFDGGTVADAGFDGGSNPPDSGTRIDSGTPGAADAGPADAGTEPVVTPDEPGGCGCSGASGLELFALGMAAVSLLSRRHRRS